MINICTLCALWNGTNADLKKNGTSQLVECSPTVPPSPCAPHDKRPPNGETCSHFLCSAKVAFVGPAKRNRRDISIWNVYTTPLTSTPTPTGSGTKFSTKIASSECYHGCFPFATIASPPGKMLCTISSRTRGRNGRRQTFSVEPESITIAFLRFGSANKQRFQYHECWVPVMVSERVKIENPYLFGC